MAPFHNRLPASGQFNVGNIGERSIRPDMAARVRFPFLNMGIPPVAVTVCHGLCSSMKACAPISSHASFYAAAPRSDGG